MIDITEKFIRSPLAHTYPNAKVINVSSYDPQKHDKSMFCRPPTADEDARLAKLQIMLKLASDLHGGHWVNYLAEGQHETGFWSKHRVASDQRYVLHTVHRNLAVQGKTPRDVYCHHFAETIGMIEAATNRVLNELMRPESY